MTAETEFQQNRTATTTTADSGTAVHLTLQGKGDVGKSLVAAILAQYFGDRGRDVRCVDTDPVNSAGWYCESCTGFGS